MAKRAVSATWPGGGWSWPAPPSACCSPAAAAAHPPLDPAGPKAERVAGLWWLMFWISVAVFALVIVLLVLALARRRGRRDEVVRSRGGEWLIWGSPDGRPAQHPKG
jgi:heme/copper-type cytochrome/quinol oxidase subunit 2